MEKKMSEITAEDVRAALRDMKVYVDVTEEDLLKIYRFAVVHANERFSPPVSEIMQTSVITAKKEMSLDEVAHLISEHNISGLPVVDDTGLVLGVLSEADILCMAGMEKDHSFKDKLKHLLGEPLHSHRKGGNVGDIMSSPAITVRPETFIKAAARLIAEKRIKRLPVVNEKGQLVGIVSRADIVKAMADR
jgi:CBS domain-containing protein